MNEHEWEVIEYNISIRKFERCKVPGGYIYHNLTYAENGLSGSESMCFVPDSPRPIQYVPPGMLMNTVPCKHDALYCAICHAIPCKETTDHYTKKEVSEMLERMDDATDKLIKDWDKALNKTDEGSL